MSYPEVVIVGVKAHLSNSPKDGLNYIRESLSGFGFIFIVIIIYRNVFGIDSHNSLFPNFVKIMFSRTTLSAACLKNDVDGMLVNAMERHDVCFSNSWADENRKLNQRRLKFS